METDHTDRTGGAAKTPRGPAPNLFLVGAPKCGTTALHAYLGAHPDITMSSVKEPYGFARDLGIWRGPFSDDRTRYLALFADMSTKLRGEASPGYLASETAAAEIADLVPDARIVIAVRNPTEAVHALHGQMRAMGVEQEPDFAKAVARPPHERKREPRFRGDDVFLDYFRFVDYAAQIERWRQTFGASRVHVMVYDDFARSAGHATAAICRWLGIEELELSGARVNQSPTPRSFVLERRLRYPKRRASGVEHISSTRWIREARRAALRWNRTTTPRRPLDDRTRRMLAERLEPGIGALERCLDRDLSAWRAPTRPDCPDRPTDG